MKKSKMNLQKMLNIIIVLLVIILLSLIGYYVYIYINKDKHINRDTVHLTEIKLEKNKRIFPPINSTFHFKTLDGKEFTLHASDKKMLIDGLKDKIIFLKIFGWDCEYCQKEIPQLIKLKKDLGDTFEVIAIEAELHSNEESLKHIKEYGINYYIINGESQKKFYKYLKTHYGWNSIIPVTIVIGKNGKVLAYEVGEKSYTLAELMKASLAKEKSDTE
jgi:thiol-disulfide isomerase/thioredoxin